jgi:hypothetical protein
LLAAVVVQSRSATRQALVELAAVEMLQLETTLENLEHLIVAVAAAVRVAATGALPVQVDQVLY